MRGFGWGAFLGLLLAALGIIAPIIWDRYKSATGLELHQVGNSILVNDTREIEKLQFLYDGQPVSSVGKLDFALTNVGRNSIRELDVVLPPTVVVTDGRILDVRITALTPAALQVSTTIDDARQKLSVRFPLLNPGDSVAFTMLVSPAVARIEASARIVGVRDLVFVPVEPRGDSVLVRLPWTFWIVFGFTAFAWLVVLSMFFLLGKEAQIDALARRGVLAFPNTGDSDIFLTFLKSGFGDEKKAELAPVLTYLQTLQKGQALTPSQTEEVRRKTLAAFQNRKAAFSAIWFVGFFAAVGTWYTVSTFVSVLK